MKKGLIIVVLAAGIGKRFWPFTTDKSVFPVVKEPLIFYNLRKLKEAGFTRFLIITNPANDALIRSRPTPVGIESTTSIQQEPGGMADALLSAKSLLAGHPIVVVNAEDIVDDTLYKDIVSGIRKSEPFIVGRYTEKYFDGGYLKLSQNRLMNIVEKPGEGQEPSKLINLVFHFFPVADIFLDRLRLVKTSRDDRYEKALDTFASEFAVSVISYSGYWNPFKYPWHVLDTMDYLLSHALVSGKGKNVDIHNNVSLEGTVYIGNNVKIFENTKIVGPVYIGDNTIIGNNNIIRDAVIGNNCVTGFNTDITRSYIGDNCWFHSNYIGDSVLEGNVSMGSGSVLSNLRLDEGEISSTISGEKKNTQRTKLGAMIGKNVRIGVNASIMPGVKIGSNSFVGAGVVLDRDIPEDSFCMMQPGYVLKKNKKKISGDRALYKAKL